MEDNSKMYNESIILIGPSGAGKSTVAEELSRMTKMPRLCLDYLANKDRREGVRDRFYNSDDYNLYLLDKVLTKAKENNLSGVVDFGAGHSVFRNQENLNKAKQMMKGFKNIILLLPYADVEKSLEIMAKRSTGVTDENREFLTNPSNRELATMVFYANDKTPTDIAREIIRYIKDREERDKNEKFDSKSLN